MTLIRKVAASSSSLSWTFDCGGKVIVKVSALVNCEWTAYHTPTS